MRTMVISNFFAVSLALTGRIDALEFALGFEGCPAEITGTEGELKSFDVFATLTTTGEDSAAGAQSWSISIEAVGGRITAIMHRGVHVSTIFDDDRNPATPPLDPFDFDLADSAFMISVLARHESDPLRLGAVSSGFLCSCDQTLQPRGTARIARLTVEATVPSDVTLHFEDGFTVNGEPIRNLVIHAGRTRLPSLGSCTISLRVGDCTGTPQSLDCNADLIPDECQLSANDCDRNGVPDDCDPDCDANDFVDACDIALGAPDLDGDGIPDACEPDCNQNQSPDDFDIASGASADCNANGNPDECDVLPLFALAQVELPGTFDSYSVIAADVDGDGDDDIVTDRISLWLSNGDGTFGPETAVAVGSGSRTSAGGDLAAGDFDGDGNLDLANVATQGAVAVLYGNGDGTFLPPESYSIAGASAGYRTRNLLSVDLNGDGLLDVATIAFEGSLNYRYRVSVIQNAGNRGFVARVLFSSVERVQEIDFAWAAGDFDRDGDQDLVFTGSAERGVNILENQGDGILVRGAFYELLSGSVGVGDIDGDQLLDLSVGSSLLLGLGDGTFAPGPNPGPGGGSAIVDLDGNGWPDLTNGSGVVRNLGRGRFLPYVTGIFIFPSSFAVGDLDRDGRPDLVAAGNGRAAVAFNRTQPAASPDADHDGIPDECPPSDPLFLRGDCDGDGQVRGVVTDAVFLLNFNFLGGTRPSCFAACDANADGQVSGVVTDAVYLLTFNFLGGPPPPAPFPGCGLGTEADLASGCERPSDSCAGQGLNP